MTKLFLDANILLEVMMVRSKLKKIGRILHEPKYEFYVSTLSVHILYYFAELEGIERSFVKKLTTVAKHLPLSTDMVTKAQDRYNGKDFEDCLQATCAEAAGCDEILTLDKNFAKNSATKLKVIVI